MTFPLFLQQTPQPPQGIGGLLREFWPVLLPVVVGLVGVYLMLPRPRRAKPLLGAAAAGLAIVIGGILLLHAESNWAESVLFWSFAGIAVTGGVLLVTQHNPVYAALSFALVVLSTCGLFLLQAAPFLMAATIIIYAGAIIVTFLFVIMLAQQSGVDDADLRTREPFWAALAGFVLMAALLGVLYRTYDTNDLDTIIARLDRASRVENEQEMEGVLGKRPGTLEIATRMTRYLPMSDDPDKNYATRLENFWSLGSVAEVRKSAADARDVLIQYRNNTYARLPRDERAAKPGAPGTLPAENVAGLGQTLFTDYLVPVELAAVLLLVATIGAIAIAGRRSEELR